MSKKAVEKGKNQLGMNPSTAQGRLIKDLLYKFLCDAGRNNCFQCGKEMSRETFTVEHKIPWRDSKNPLELFFDLENISFSHFKCNVGSARVSNHRRPGGKPRIFCPSDASYARGCRCKGCTGAHTDRTRKNYNPENRKASYERNK